MGTTTEDLVKGISYNELGEVVIYLNLGQPDEALQKVLDAPEGLNLTLAPVVVAEDTKPVNSLCSCRVQK